MGKVVEKKRRKKKKGRPSLLDIQKRSLRLQKTNQTTPKKIPNFPPTTTNPKSPPPPSTRRFTRRNPNPDAISDPNDEDEEHLNTKRRREKKLNVVLRTNPNQRFNSLYLNPELFGSDSDEHPEEPPPPEQLKKRKIDGSDFGNGKKEEKHSIQKATGGAMETGPTTPLPDKKLLFFILDRLQKKDTYGVFADPVDPEELPDYHEIIVHPMDFGTVRKKLETGAYANLELFEKDVFLITSNAMQYNAQDTIYFRQARSIQELAKKNFEELRQESDDNEEPEPKIEPPKVVRRGRPPGRPSIKTLKQTLGKASFGHSSDATLAKGGDNAILYNGYNLRRPLSDKYGSTDASRRTYNGSRNGETHSRWSADHKSERNDELYGSSMKGFSTRFGKKQWASEESRRDTYMNPHPSVLGSEPSVLTTFDGEQKQLTPVGLHTEHGYARSLARFVADLGPVAWKVASKKIERVLPPGMKFGPGWVGESEAPLQHTQALIPSPPQSVPSQHSSPLLETSSFIVPFVESKGDRLMETQKLSNDTTSDCLSNRILHQSNITSPLLVANASAESTIDAEADKGLNTDSGYSPANSCPSGTRPPFPNHQSPSFNSGMNGFNDGFGFSNSSPMNKLVRPAWSNGSYNSEPSIHSRVFDMVSRNSFVNSMPANRVESNNPKLSGSTLKPCSMMSNSVREVQDGSLVVLDPCQRFPLQQNLDTIPPDLNIRFQSSVSPSSSVRVDSPQPDLALQL